MEAGLGVEELALEADGLVDALGVELIEEAAPGIEGGGPDDLARSIGHGERRTQMIAVEIAEGDRPLGGVLLQMSVSDE